MAARASPKSKVVAEKDDERYTGTITVTFGDRCESSAGMEILGESANEGFDHADFTKIVARLSGFWAAPSNAHMNRDQSYDSLKRRRISYELLDPVKMGEDESNSSSEESEDQG